MIRPASTSVAGLAADAGPGATDWITACTGAVALIAAGIAAYATWRQFKLLVLANERDQAAKFVMWATYADGIKILYSNDNSLPVYSVCATIMVDGTELASIEMVVCGPTKEPQNAQTDPTVEAIKKRIDGNLTEAARKKRYRELAERTTVAVRFRDTAGIGWDRAIDGKLTKVPTKEHGHRVARIRRRFGQIPAHRSDQDPTLPQATIVS
ncbi:MAG TPA: hypothetical protein VGG05_14695 [Pseudonocardiaceae bacterium]|jgi:hypothetical protein